MPVSIKRIDLLAPPFLLPSEVEEVGGNFICGFSQTQAAIGGILHLDTSTLNAANSIALIEKHPQTFASISGLIHTKSAIQGVLDSGCD